MTAENKDFLSIGKVRDLKNGAAEIISSRELGAVYAVVHDVDSGGGYFQAIEILCNKETASLLGERIFGIGNLHKIPGTDLYYVCVQTSQFRINEDAFLERALKKPENNIVLPTFGKM